MLTQAQLALCGMTSFFAGMVFMAIPLEALNEAAPQAATRAAARPAPARISTAPTPAVRAPNGRLIHHEIPVMHPHPAIVEVLICKEERRYEAFKHSGYFGEIYISAIPHAQPAEHAEFDLGSTLEVEEMVAMLDDVIKDMDSLKLAPIGGREGKDAAIHDLQYIREQLLATIEYKLPEVDDPFAEHDDADGQILESLQEDEHE